MLADRELSEHFGQIHDLGAASELLGWDEQTMMPRAGLAARAEALATLERLRHELLASDRTGELLEGLRDRIDGAPYDSDEASFVRVGRRDWEKARRVPAELSAEIARAGSLGQATWREAREASDFGLLLPALERNIELKLSYAACFDSEDSYDPLLDDYEPGMRTAEIAPLLDELKTGLRPLIEAVGERPPVDDSCMRGDFPEDDQRRFCEALAGVMPVEANSWRLDPTAHPFAIAVARGDLRITTRYDEAQLGVALFSLIHEFGHGIYEQGVAAEIERTPLGGGTSLGVHESQSRLWENWIGRGRPFCRFLQPRLAEAFPDAFGSVDAEALYRAVNRVEPSLIRTEADVVTYDLHIVARFELERELFAGTLAPADLAEAFASRIESYLGVEVPNDADGVLQDVHWSFGAFGYFPTYSLGNIIAGQLWARALEDLPDLDGQLERGELAPLREWLREAVHRHGRKLTSRELIERISGGPLDAGPYLGQLGAKMAEIYGV